MRRPVFGLCPAAGALGPADLLAGLTSAGWPPPPRSWWVLWLWRSSWSRQIRGSAPRLGVKCTCDLVRVSASRASFSSPLMPGLPNAGEAPKLPRLSCYRPGATLGPHGRCCCSELRSSGFGVRLPGLDFSALPYGSRVPLGKSLNFF